MLRRPPPFGFFADMTNSHPKREDGAAAVEYALIAAAIAAVIVAVVVGLGVVTKNSYNDSCTKISAQMGSDC